MNSPKTDSAFTRRSLIKTTTAAAAIGCVAAARGDQSKSPYRYPFYRATGAARDLGRQHGEQAAEKIKAHLDYMARTMKLSPKSIRERALRFRPLFETHCPRQVKEIEGLAEGAKITMADALAVNIRGALSKTKDGGCTAFAVHARRSATGGVLIGQNSDMLPDMVDFAYVLHLKPRDRPEVLIWTFGGMVGYHGLNSRGVAHFANDVGGGPATRFAMPHYPLKRRMLECSRMSEILQLFRTYPVWASGNYVLCDGAGAILDVETTPQGFEQLPSDDGLLAHANHFISKKFATKRNHEQSAADSFARQRRMDALLRSPAGRITVADVQRFLRDREGAPTAICRQAATDDPAADWRSGGITVASIVAEPSRRRMHVAAGNAIDAPFTTYEM